MTDRDEAIEAAERLIRDERQRQISAEGWTAEHDDEHDDGSLLHVAVFYYRHAIGEYLAMRDDGAPLGWPWDKYWWKPKRSVRNLVRAGALCMAERDRLWRIEMKYASAATKRMARSYNWWPFHVRQKYDVIVEKLAASLHRTEPQIAPTCICPRCSATIVGEMNGPEDEPVVTDAERHALAENIEKYCKAIDEAGEKGWRGAVMGDRVELGRLTHENRNLIIFSLCAGGWREDMENAPRDGTRILSWWDGQCIITHWNDRVQRWQPPSMMTIKAHDKSAWQPTHWMPLPSAPKNTDKVEG